MTLFNFLNVLFFVINLLRRGFRIIKSEGILEFLLRSASFLRKKSGDFYGYYLAGFPMFPVARYNGVKVKESFLPWEEAGDPTYESGLIEAIRSEVESGDRVVIVGGGKGVTAVEAARRVGNQGEVHVYEGSESQVEKTKQTVKFNNLSDLVTVHHKVVGPAISVYNNEDTTNQIAPEQLPDCDVLELDCEGAEIAILESITHQPRAILVETHGMYNASTQTVRLILESKSYDIISKSFADERKSSFCIENDIYVLTALHNGRVTP